MAGDSLSRQARGAIVVGIVLALGLFLWSIFLPLAGNQISTSITCETLADGSTNYANCSWGSTLGTRLVEPTTAQVYNLLPLIAIVVIFIVVVVVALKALDLF
jgi:hypothetical protein